MNPRYLLLLVLGLVLLAAAADLAWFLPQLPAQIATHFGVRGVADGWSSKTSFAVTHGGLLVFMPALFVGLAWFMPRLPVSLVNLPHRDYWLAPARRARTMETVSRFLLAFGIVTTSFLVGLMHLTLAANLNPPPRLGTGFAVLLIGQITVLVGMVVWLLVKFRRPRA